MAALSVQQRYEKYYTGEKARRGIFDALAAWRSPKRALYPGSVILVTASFVFPSVVYVDTDRNARRFFAELDDVVSFVERHKAYREQPRIAFHGVSYEAELDEPDGSFDLLISLYAGFISKPCKRYLQVGGILVANNSHGDAGLASIDPDYAFVGVIQGRGERLGVVEEGLDDYFIPKQEMQISEALLRKRGRGIGYTNTASAYLFKRVR